MTPNHGAAEGETIQVTGANFGPGNPAPTVTVGGKACTQIQVDSHTQLTCTAPQGVGTEKPINVTLDGQSSNTDVTYEYDGV